MEQKNRTGSILLKIAGILMIIGGAFGIIGGLTVVACASAAAAVGAGSTALTVAAIILLVAGVIELVAGIVGVANSNKPEKATTCIVWGVLVALLSIASLIITKVGGGEIKIMNIISTIALPVFYIIAAFVNKKNA